MKIKLSQLINSVTSGALGHLANTDLPIKTAFRLKSMLRECGTHIEDHDRLRADILSTHGTLNEEKGIYEFDSPEKQAEADREYAELLRTEIDIPGEPLKLRDFHSSSAFRAAHLAELEWLIDTEFPAVAAGKH